MSATRPMPEMCILSIRHEHFLLPVAKALKVVELMAGALGVDNDFNSDRTRWRVGDKVRTKFESVRPDDLILSEAACAAAVPQAPKRLSSR